MLLIASICRNVNSKKFTNHYTILSQPYIMSYIALHQVSYQLKILTTALFSVTMLNKRVSRLQWVALVCLFVGVAVVQMQPETKATTSQQNAPHQSAFVGLVAVGAASVMSGFAGVYFEKLLKHTSPSIFLRNVQLGVIGFVFGLITVMLGDGSEVSSAKITNVKTFHFEVRIGLFASFQHPWSVSTVAVWHSCLPYIQ
jgi:UDP-galactose transporter